MSINGLFNIVHTGIVYFHGVSVKYFTQNVSFWKFSIEYIKERTGTNVQRLNLETESELLLRITPSHANGTQAKSCQQPNLLT